MVFLLRHGRTVYMPANSKEAWRRECELVRVHLPLHFPSTAMASCLKIVYNLSQMSNGFLVITPVERYFTEDAIN